MLVNKVPQCSSMESKNVFSSPFTVFWLQPCTMGWFHRECSENIFWTQTDRVWPKVIRLWLILGFRAFRRPNGQIRALQVIRSFSTEIVVRSDICQIGWFEPSESTQPVMIRCFVIENESKKLFWPIQLFKTSQMYQICLNCRTPYLIWSVLSARVIFLDTVDVGEPVRRGC